MKIKTKENLVYEIVEEFIGRERMAMASPPTARSQDPVLNAQLELFKYQTFVDRLSIVIGY